jgi:hypothetical protein
MIAPIIKGQCQRQVPQGPEDPIITHDKTALCLQSKRSNANPRQPSSSPLGPMKNIYIMKFMTMPLWFHGGMGSNKLFNY